MRAIYIVYREEVGPCPAKAKSKTHANEPVGTHIVVSALTLLVLSHEPGMDGTEHIAQYTPHAQKELKEPGAKISQQEAGLCTHLIPKCPALPSALCHLCSWMQILQI